MRIGRVLEDLDSLAGLVAFDHWCETFEGFAVWVCDDSCLQAGAGFGGGAGGVVTGGETQAMLCCAAPAVKNFSMIKYFL